MFGKFLYRVRRLRFSNHSALLPIWLLCMRGSISFRHKAPPKALPFSFSALPPGRSNPSPLLKRPKVVGWQFPRMVDGCCTRRSTSKAAISCWWKISADAHPHLLNCGPHQSGTLESLIGRLVHKYALVVDRQVCISSGGGKLKTEIPAPRARDLRFAHSGFASAIVLSSASPIGSLHSLSLARS